MLVTRDDLNHLAAWIAAEPKLEPPQSVYDAASAQLLNAVRSAYLGRHTSTGKALLDATRQVSAQKRMLLPSGDKTGLLDAIELATRWSSVLGQDDVLVSGFSCTPVVWVSLYVGAWRNKKLADVRDAILIGNEVGGRLAQALLFDIKLAQLSELPQRAAATAATAHLLGLDETATRNALALALFDTGDRPLATLLQEVSSWQTLSEAVVSGVRGAILAGSADPELGERVGNEIHYADNMISRHQGLFSTLGSSWITDSLIAKKYPTRLWFQTVLAGLEQMFQEENTPNIYDIDTVLLEVNPLTYAADSHKIVEGQKEIQHRPVFVSHSLRHLVAAHIQKLTKSDSKDAERQDELLELADHVEVRLVQRLGWQMLDDLEESLPFGNWALTVPKRALRKLERDVNDVLHLPFDIYQLARPKTLLRNRGRLFYLAARLQRLYWRRVFSPLYGYIGLSHPHSDIQYGDWTPILPVQLSIRTKSGETFSTHLDRLPAGDKDDRHAAVEQSFLEDLATFESKKTLRSLVDQGSSWSGTAKEFTELFAG